MKPFRYIIAVIALCSYIVLGIAFIALYGALGYFALISFVMLFIPYSIIEGIIVMLFGKNHLENLICWVTNKIAQHLPIQRVIDLIFENRIVKYGNNCFEELADDIQILLKLIISPVINLSGTIQSIFRSKVSDYNPGQNEKIVNQKEQVITRGVKTLDKKSIRKLDTVKQALKKTQVETTKQGNEEVTITDADLDEIKIVEEITPVKKSHQLNLFTKPKSVKKKPLKQIDWLEINSKKIEIGKIGELIALKFEIERLLSIGVKDPSQVVVHSSKVLGDGLGYDITSVDENNSKIFIEVKATSSSNDIIITRNEFEVMDKLKDSYFIYIVNCSNVSSATVKRLSYESIKNNYTAIPDRYKLKQLDI